MSGFWECMLQPRLPKTSNFFLFFFQTLGWNVGAVYLVASTFQALILVCATYTLLFLKSVLSYFSSQYYPISQVSIILFLKSVSSKKMSWRKWFPGNLIAFGSHFLICCLAFRRREWKNPEPNVVTTSYTQYGRFWGSINAILKYKQCGLQCMCSGHSKVGCCKYRQISLWIPNIWVATYNLMAEGLKGRSPAKSRGQEPRFVLFDKVFLS